MTRFTLSTCRAWAEALLLAVLATGWMGEAQQQVDPTTQIQWPLIAEAGTPGAVGVPCSAANYGQPYQNTAVTPNTYYTCGTDGWVIRGGGAANITGLTNQCVPLGATASSIANCSSASDNGVTFAITDTITAPVVNSVVTQTSGGSPNVIPSKVQANPTVYKNNLTGSDYTWNTGTTPSIAVQVPCVVGATAGVIRFQMKYSGTLTNPASGIYAFILGDATTTPNGTPLNSNIGPSFINASTYGEATTNYTPVQPFNGAQYVEPPFTTSGTMTAIPIGIAPVTYTGGNCPAGLAWVALDAQAAATGGATIYLNSATGTAATCLNHILTTNNCSTAGNWTAIGGLAPYIEVWSQSTQAIQAASGYNGAIIGTSAGGEGVIGTSVTGDGVGGNSNSSYGVAGNSRTSVGVYGNSTSGPGILGTTTNSYGGQFQKVGNLAFNDNAAALWANQSVDGTSTYAENGPGLEVSQSNSLLSGSAPPSAYGQVNSHTFWSLNPSVAEASATIPMHFDTAYLPAINTPIFQYNAGVSHEITCLVNPSLGTETLTLNNTVWTFVTSGATGNQVNIGVSCTATMTALYTALAASSDTNTEKSTWTNPSSGVVVAVPNLTYVTSSFVQTMSTNTAADFQFGLTPPFSVMQNGIQIVGSKTQTSVLGGGTDTELLSCSGPLTNGDYVVGDSHGGCADGGTSPAATGTTITGGVLTSGDALKASGIASLTDAGYPEVQSFTYLTGACTGGLTSGATAIVMSNLGQVGTAGCTATATGNRVPLPEARTLYTMEVQGYENSANVGGEVTTIYKNGTATAATCALPSGGANSYVLCSWAGTVSLAQGDGIYAAIAGNGVTENIVTVTVTIGLH